MTTLHPHSLGVAFESFFSNLKIASGQTEDVCDPIEEPPSDPIADLYQYATEGHIWHMHWPSPNKLMVSSRVHAALQRIANVQGAELEKQFDEYVLSLKEEEDSTPRYDKKAYTNLLPSIHRSHKRKRKGKQRR